MLETTRLILRQLKEKDIPDLYKMIFSPFVMKFNVMKLIPYEEFLENTKNSAADNFYLALKGSDQIIGEISLHRDQIRYNVNSITLSYWLGEDYIQQGYMHEALEALIDFLFHHRNIEIISARVFSHNIASQRLLEKLGFESEAYLKHAVRNYEGEVFDDILYVLFKDPR